MIKELELSLVRNGAKPAIRQAYYEDELGAVEEFCRKNALFMLRSEFRIVPEGFDKGMVAKKDDKDAMVFVYISRDEMAAHKVAYHEAAGNHLAMGLALGYPECCCRFFEKDYARLSRLDNNYESLVLENSKEHEYPFFTNIFLRKEGISLLSHFPCHLGCGESIVIGKRNYGFLTPAMAREALRLRCDIHGKKFK